jgi:Tfp pilus assembly protein PilV
MIDVLIAMMIVTIALVAIVGMFPQGYRQVIDAGRMTLAVGTAR